MSIERLEEITDQLAATERRNQSERLVFQQVVEHLPNTAVLVVDRDLRFAFVRGMGMDITLSYNANEMEGRLLEDVLTKEDYDKFLPIYKRAMSGVPTYMENRHEGKIWTMVFDAVRDGHRIPFCFCIASYVNIDKTLLSAASTSDAT